MAGGREGKAEAEYRKKRVQKIKKIIVTTCIVLLVLPTVLSLFLMVKVLGMQRQIDELVLREKVGQSEMAEDGEERAYAKSKEISSPEPTRNMAVSASSVAAEQRKVYLTFDDGPGVQTSEILDILKEQNVKATFFVTGKEDAYSRKVYKRIVKEGHTLGMHSYSHVYTELYSSVKAFRNDLRRIYELLHEVTGKYPVFYRFPGGSSVTGNGVKAKDLIPVLEEKGIVYLDWNVVSPDTANASVSKSKMIAGILEGVAAYDTSVVMFYDVADRPMTVRALPEIIKQLKKENYELLPVDEKTALVRHNQ